MLVPVPLAVWEDMATLVAVMVNPGAAAWADEFEDAVMNTARVPSMSRRYLGMAESFLRVACTLPAWLDGV